jgi:hypothetical protein
MWGGFLQPVCRTPAADGLTTGSVFEDLPYGKMHIIDSTALKVCHIKREHQNKVFEGIASKGKSTLGCFFGFSCILSSTIRERSSLHRGMRTTENLCPWSIF